MGILSDLNRSRKKAQKKILNPFVKGISKISDKFIPNELRWAMPYAAGIGTLMLPPTMSPWLRALAASGMNVAGQIGADETPIEDISDINALSVALAGGLGALGSDRVADSMRSGIESGMSPQEAANIYGRGTPEALAAEGTLAGGGTGAEFLQGAENITREGVASLSDYVTGGRETLAALGKRPQDLMTLGGVKDAGMALGPAISQGTGDVFRETAIDLKDEADRLQAEEEAEIEATSTANEGERATLQMTFMRQAGHDEETIKETLDMNDLGEYYEPPVEDAAQGGIIGLKNGGRIGFKKGGWDPGAGRDKKGYQTSHPSHGGGGGWDPGAGGAQHIPKKKTVVTGGANTPVIKDTPVRADPNFNFGVNIGQGLGGADLAKLFNNYYKLSNLDNETNPNTWDYNPPTITTPYADPILNEVTETFTDQSFLDTLADIKNRTQNQLIDLNLGMKAGGIIGLKNGGMLNLGGNEMDYRGGGFVPIGKRERADDVPARLSKNEFVMTADAVKAAGGGSVNKGAQRMYNVMNNLEARA